MCLVVRCRYQANALIEAVLISELAICYQSRILVRWQHFLMASTNGRIEGIRKEVDLPVGSAAEAYLKLIRTFRFRGALRRAPVP